MERPSPAQLGADDVIRFTDLGHFLRELAGPLGESAAKHPAVPCGSYPFYRGVLGSSLIGRCADRDVLEAAVSDLRAILVAKGFDRIEETKPE